MSYKVLDELIYHCTRCKLDLNHRITLMKGAGPGRVMCLTCKTERSYRAPKSALTKRAPSKSAVKTKPLAISEWETKLRNPARPPVAYSVDGAFSLNDIIAHKSFGPGIITEFISPDKMNVYFDGDGLKMLKGKKA